MTTDPAVLEKWIEKWEHDRTPWHKTINNPFILKYYDKLTNGRSSIQIFVPMCGKCIDMKWLYDKGHKIVGVEYCEKAIKDFFREQSLNYEMEDVESLKGKLFKTSDGNIKIFCCDIFLFNKDCAGLMDAVWDRGAFGAVEKGDRKRYAKLMLSLLAPGYRYLFSVLVYNDWFYSGCPRNVPDKLMHFLFDQDCIVTQLEKNKADSPSLPSLLDVDDIHNAVWMLTEK